MPEKLEMRLQELETEIQQLRTALQSRIVIEQAKGVLSIVLDMSVDEAFELMRGRARSNQRLLQDVAREVIETRGRSMQQDG